MINARKYNIALNSVRGSCVPFISVTAGDVGSILFYITVWNQKEEVKIPIDSIINIYFKKPDGTKVVQSTIDGSVAIQGGKILCKVASGTIASAGQVQAEVKILSNKHEMLTTPMQFEFNVQKTLVCDEDIMSTNEYPLLMELIKKVENATDENAIFGDAPIFTINHGLNAYVFSSFSIYDNGFGLRGFGENGFGGDNLEQLRVKVIHNSRNSIDLQLSNNFKHLIPKQIVPLKDNDYMVEFEDTTVMLYVRVKA